MKYRTDKLNQAADAVSHRPKTENDNSRDSGSEEYESILYAVVCDDLCEIIMDEKLPLDIIRALEMEMTKQEQLLDSEKIGVHSEMEDILSKITPGMMKEAYVEDVDISKTISEVKSGKKTTLALIQKIKSRAVNGTSANLIGCTECMSKMGPSTTNSFYQLSLRCR